MNRNSIRALYKYSFVILHFSGVFNIILILLGNEILFHLYVFVLAFLIRKHFSFGSYVTDVFLPELFLTMIAFLLVYGVLIFLARRFDLKVNKGEVKIV